MVASLFVYRMMVLPKMEKRMLSEIQQNITNFLWNGARPKVAKQILTLPKKLGGLNLCDLEKRDKSLKICWIQILHKDQKLANVVYQNLCGCLKEKIWLCNLNTMDIRYVTQDTFWKQVLEAWFEYKSLADNTSTINEEIIWYNSKIKIQGYPILWEDCVQKGLMYVYQLYPKGVLLSIKKAWDLYSLDVMRYNSLISAIPKEWRSELRNSKERKHQHIFYETTCARNRLVNHAYKMLLTDNVILKDKANAWKLIFNENFTKEDLVRCTKEIYMTTNIPKYRSFQYRLMQRGLVLNTHLYRWGKISSSMCSFCGKEPETYDHLFVMCEKIQPIWIKIENYML